MGSGMGKPVESVIIERSGTDAFRVGVAEMNGRRPSMEDAHVVYPQANWGFFSVLDGHSGSECSAFIAKRLREELSKSPEPPKDDEAVKSLALRLDEEFLSRNEGSGSTATFAIVVAPSEANGRYQLRVGNVGDSRVLLSRSDGTLVEGTGTDGGITTDHKPDYESEKARIERTGGTVQFVMGVARVNGELAVSRAFGDARYKETGGPGLEERPVTALPEMVTLECDPSDFLVLVCDGISEGSFPNREVTRCAAEVLKSGGKVDPGAAAAAVCRKALECNSSDNLSCMIVLLGGGEVAGPAKEFQPGPVKGVRKDRDFQNTYELFAKQAGYTLVEAIDMRYRDLQELLKSGGGKNTEELEKEFGAFQGGPPKDADQAARRAWFENWLHEEEKEDQEFGVDSKHYGDADSEIPAGRVDVSSGAAFKMAVEAHPSIEWTDDLEEFAGRSGLVLQVDKENDKTEVKFSFGRAWLPTSALKST